MNSYRKTNTNFIIRRESIEPIPTVINNEILNLQFVDRKKEVINYPSRGHK